jgi:hypothetical protein
MIDSIAASSRAGRPIAGQPRARDLQFFRSNGRCNHDGPQDDRRVDALTHARPYKQAWTVADSVREIARQSGRQFDPEIVAAFLSVLPEPGEAIERRTRFSSPVLTA